MSGWLLCIAFVPLGMFVYCCIRCAGASIKMVDEINAVVPMQQQVDYVGFAHIFAWRKHATFFPDRPNLRTVFKKWALRAAAWWAGTITTLLLLAWFTR